MTNWNKDTLDRTWSWFTIGSLFPTHRGMHSFMLGKTGCVLPWLPLSKCCIDLSTCCFPKHWHVSNRIRGQTYWRDTEMEIKNTDAGVPLLGVNSGWLRRTQAPSQGDRVRRVWHSCVSSIFMCRPSSNTAASPKDQGRCLLHSHFQKVLVGFQVCKVPLSSSFASKSVLFCRRAILQEKPIEAAGGGCCQASFVNSAQLIKFRQSEHHGKDVDPIFLDWGSTVQFWNWLCSS